LVNHIFPQDLAKIYICDVGHKLILSPEEHENNIL